MNKKLLWLILSLLVCVGAILTGDNSPSNAQVNFPDGVRLFGTIGNDGVISGYFSRNQSDSDRDWCVFVGANGKAYKMSLIERNVHELYIDGQKVPDSEIWKHTAEYKSFLEKYWRSQDIENESREIEQKIKPLAKRIEAVSKEIEKLDLAEDRGERSTSRNSESFVDTKLRLREQQKKLDEIENELDQKMGVLSKQQERLSDEQESLGLEKYLDDVLKQIATDIKVLGAIKSTDKLSYKLSNRELIINGERASPEILELLKIKYILDRGGESGFIYRWKGEI